MSENIDRGEQGQDPKPMETGNAVSRREFIKLAGLAGAGLTLAGGLGGFWPHVGPVARPPRLRLRQPQLPRPVPPPLPLPPARPPRPPRRAGPPPQWLRATAH